MKKFRYSAIYKVLCVLLSLVTFVSSCAIVTACVLSYGYNDGKRPESYTQAPAFERIFSDDAQAIISDFYVPRLENNFRQELEAQREATVDSAYSRFLEIGKSIPEQEEYYEDDYEQTTMWYEDNISVPVQTTSQGEITFAVPYVELSGYLPEGYDSKNDGEKEIKAAINDQYDSFIESECDDLAAANYIYSPYYGRENLKFYIAQGDNINQNIEKLNEDDVYKQNVYFIIKDGKVESKGISSDAADRIYRYKEYLKAKDVTAYIYVDCTYDGLSNPNIVDYIRTYDAYLGIKDFYGTAVSCYDHFALYACAAAVLLVMSFVFAFLYLSVAGKKEKDLPAKLVFIDYVPFELHLGAVGGVCFGLGVLIVSISDLANISRLCVGGIVLCITAMWLLVFEFCSSVARCARAERKLYKNFLVYDIACAVIFVAKKLIKLGAKLFKATGKSAKKSNESLKNLFITLKYKPTKFKKNMIIIAIIYALCNVIMLIILGFIWLCVFDEIRFGYGGGIEFVLALLPTFADLGVNIYLFNKVLKYIQQLDTIIDTASRHEDITLNIDALPQSLKTLAESMKYTNTELQNAVAKAVKDERLKTELITNVSHDLKTPLTSIITYVDLLSKCDIQDEKAQEYIKVLDDKGAKLKRLIDDLIEASKVNSGNITVNLSNLNLYELCLQATVDAQADFEKAGLELIVKESDDAITISADGPKAFRIVENLLSNAKKYSAKGSRVYVCVYRENNMGVFEIKNVSAQPLDISPDELTQRFVRGDKSRNQEGNGLGLSIAKELCKVQNGDLEITIDGDLFKAKVKLPLA
ncbi:MAG: sensor histidine kinase [Eubacterium sp.]